MDTTTQRYHLMLMALEARVLKALASNLALAQKKILLAQLQAAILGSQAAMAQLEAELPDDQDIARAHYTPPTPVHVPTTADKDKNLTIASTIARTAIIEAFRQAAIAVYAANDVEKWVWVTHFSDNTCKFCISMDGTVHPITEELESHPNCHCTMAPYLA